MTAADIFLGFLAILFPPLPVWVKCGICSADSLINILLFILGYIPGLIHAWYIIAKYPEAPYEYQPVSGERGDNRVGYTDHQAPSGQQQSRTQPKRSGGMNYGTQNAGGSSSNATHQPQQQGITAGGEGSSDGQGVPPSYAEVVAGDNKIQTRD